MESNFDIAALFASLGFLELSILILTAFFASVVSGISGYGGGMTLGLLVSPFIPVKLLVPLMSVFVLFSNLSRMYYYRKNIFWKKGFYFAIISTPFLIAGTNFYAAVSEKTLFKAQRKNQLNLKTVGIGIYAKSGASTVELSKEIKKHKNNNLPILALESTIIAHGMPYPENYLFAKNIELNCRKKGVAPATIAVLDGRVHIGLTNKELKRVCQSKKILKLSKFILTAGRF